MQRLLVFQPYSLKSFKVFLLDVAMNAKSLKLYVEKHSPKWAIRTSLLPYERNAEAKTLNIPLYMLFILKDEIL